MGRLEDLGVLQAHAGQVVDVEEAPVPAGGRVDVEEPLAQRRVGPEAVRVVGRHVVGHDVEDQPQAGLVRRVSERSNSSSPPRSAEIRPGSITS